MAKRNPLAAKQHAANVRERKKRDALRMITFVPVDRPKVCSVPAGEPYGYYHLGALPENRDRAVRKIKGATRIVLELAYRARLKAKDPVAWEARCNTIPMAARNAWCS
jgi:hypothetical protein